MNISVSQSQGRVPVTVFRLDGQLDGQNFHELIARAREAFGSGTRDLLLDLSDLTYLSSAGLVSLHTLALMSRGETVPDPEQGWAALKSMDRSRDGGLQQHVKLLNPSPEILSVLEMVGFTEFFEVHTDMEKAVRSF